MNRASRRQRVPHSPTGRESLAPASCGRSVPRSRVPPRRRPGAPTRVVNPPPRSARGARLTPRHESGGSCRRFSHPLETLLRDELILSRPRRVALRDLLDHTLPHPPPHRRGWILAHQRWQVGPRHVLERRGVIGVPPAPLVDPLLEPGTVALRPLDLLGVWFGRGGLDDPGKYGGQRRCARRSERKRAARRRCW